MRARLRQSGFSLLSVLLGLAVSAILTAALIQKTELDSQVAAGTAQGEILGQIRNAYNNYALENYPQLQNNLPISKAGVTLAAGTALGETQAPTIANLITMGYLTAGYSPIAMLGATTNAAGSGAVQPRYRVLLERLPAGCVTIACNITGQVWIDQPIWRRGTTQIAPAALGALTKQVGVDAVYATNAVPTQLVNVTGATFTNPDPTSRAGIVAARVGVGSSGFGRFVLVDDPRDLRFFGSFDIRGDLTVGQTTSGGINCALVEILRSGQVFTRSSTCIRRAWLDGSTGQIAAADATGVATAVLDGSTGSITSRDATGAQRAGLGYNGIGQSQAFADVLINTAGNASLRADGAVTGTTVIISGTGVLGAPCTTPNAAAWGTVGT